MELLNATNMQAGYTLGMQPDGRELLVVAVKGTFGIPADGSDPRLLDEQLPLIEADTFTGEPGLTAPQWETDYAPRKARCDVALIGNAYAPGERPVTTVTVGLKVGQLTKIFNVIGNRTWKSSGGRPRASAPEPFEQMPISYDRAFGGNDTRDPDPARHAAYMPNPVGRGFHAVLNDEFVDGAPLPNTEERDRSVTDPGGDYRPMAFGPVGRGWEPRLAYAGTYDQNWLDKVFPFLPMDFDERYYQCAPEDQQTDYLSGGEEVQLVNLTPQGRVSFRLPVVQVPIVFFYKRGGRHETQAVADTLVLDPDEGRFTITWRANLPLKQNIFEVIQVLAGTRSRAWWRARELGKTYYTSLDALQRAKRTEALESEE